MKRLLLVVTALLILVVGGISCAPSAPPTPAPTPTITVDEPYLYASEAIRIAKQHSLTSPVSPGERRAATHIRRLEALGGYDEFITFEATYQGNGKWIVLLRVLSETGPLESWLYRWTVFEKNLNGVFLDETKMYP